MAVNKNYQVIVDAVIDTKKIPEQLEAISKKTTIKFDTSSVQKGSTEITKFKDKMGNLVTETKKLDDSGNTLSKTITTVGKSADKAGQSFTSCVAKVAKFAAATAVIGVFTAAVKSGIDAVTGLDGALTEMSKVSDMSSESLKDYAKQAAEVGETVSKTATEIVEAATEFAKSGYNEEQSMQLAKVAS